MKRKGESISNIIFGLVFLAVGVLLVSMHSEMKIVQYIAYADLALGAALLIGGIIGMVRSGPSANDEPAQPAEEAEIDWNKPAPKEMKAEAAVAAAVPAAAASVEELTAREAELRRAAKQRRAEARQAAAEADDANARAAEAERQLVEAEQEVKMLHGVDQQAALARVDKLADRAMDLSQQAAVASRRAKMADRAYRQAVEEHNAAMDAAAEAMIAAEDAGWSK